MKRSLFPLVFLAAMLVVFGLPAAALSAEPGLPAGFIAMSDSEMTWADAKAWCQQQGGKLPRFDNRDSLKLGEKVNQIDGFGASSSSWPQAFPGDTYYWTGTILPGNQEIAWVVLGKDGKVVGYLHPRNNIASARVVCVP